MKTVEPELQAFLQEIIDRNSDTISFCELFTITLTTGDVLRFTDYDFDVTVGGHTYAGTGDIIPVRGSIKGQVGFDVGEMDLHFLTGEQGDAELPVVLNGLTLQQMAVCGLTDKADVLVTRLIWQDEGVIPPWAPVHKFGGTISKPTEITNFVVSFQVKSHMHKLQRQIPQTVMQASCNLNHYFDDQCGVQLADFGVNCIVAIGSNRILLNAAALGVNQADGYFDKGFVTFTSGKNKGLGAAIKSSTQADGLSLCAPLLLDVTAGDTFIAYPACDRTRGAGGCLKFDNLDHFRGYPYVPPPETAI